MTVSKQGNTYKVFKISAASHNFLALEITDAAPDRIAIEGHQIGAEQPSGIDGEQLAKAVQKAMAAGNALFGVQLFPKRIQYVVSDTPDMEQYEILTQEIMTVAAKDFAAHQDRCADSFSPLPSS